MVEQQIKGLMTRHNLTQAQAAKYLGVPTTTLLKWLNGERKPSSSVVRLIEVLSILETFAPAIHNTLLPKD